MESGRRVEGGGGGERETSLTLQTLDCSRLRNKEHYQRVPVLIQTVCACVSQRESEGLKGCAGEGGWEHY